MTTAQSYPLFVCTYSPVLEEGEKRDFRNAVALLQGWTYRVVGWTETSEYSARPVVIQDGVPDPIARSIRRHADFEGPCFFGESKTAAISAALKFLFKDQMPSGWELMIKP